jgi:hypothetical protein
MMNLKPLIFGLLLFQLFIAQAQINVGPRIDVGGMFLGNVISPIFYNPKKAVECTNPLFKSGKGYYYNASNKKNEGILSIHNGKIVYFRENNNSDLQKLELDDIRSFVIEKDSFLIHEEDKLISKKIILQAFMTIDGDEFAHTPFKKSSTNWNSLEIEFYVKNRNSTKYTAVRKKSGGFIKDIAPLTKKYPFVYYKVVGRHWEYQSLYKILKYIEYIKKYKTKGRIFFDSNLVETNDQENALYYAYITKYKNGEFIMEFFDRSNIKKVKANFYEIFPNKLDGQVLNYYPNGKVASLHLFKKHEAKKKNLMLIINKEDLEDHKLVLQQTYYPNGKHKTKAIVSTANDQKFKIVKFNDSEGNNLLDKSYTGEFTIFDSLWNTNYFFTIKNGYLKESYRVVNGIKVYQAITPKSFRGYELQSELQEELRRLDDRNTFSTNKKGIVLVSLIVDDKGFVKSYYTLNKINKEYDDLIKNIIVDNCIDDSKGTRIKFPKYKVKRKAVYYEVLIPFKFNILPKEKPKRFRMNDYPNDPFPPNQQ